eukprot:TRINITY_DN69595_c0_g1_i1.p1 TRINITY_DN69595_c0_g1~~TRINITY_DN69595_c0_g1_i1.p1  ORF type:complete len:392 (+),score=61.19 TRINITY_DN69595_c0_g1_i1:59-1234(+)
MTDFLGAARGRPRTATGAARPSSEVGCVSPSRSNSTPALTSSPSPSRSISTPTLARTSRRPASASYRSNLNGVPSPSTSTSREAARQRQTSRGSAQGPRPSSAAVAVARRRVQPESTASVSCADSGLSTPTVRPLTGCMSASTLFENQKIERYLRDMPDRCALNDQGTAVVQVERPHYDEPVTSSENFVQEFLDIEEQLAEFAKNVRMEHLVADTERVEEERRRADAKRRLEEKERRLRQLAKEVADPKKRVEAQLQRLREFGSGDLPHCKAQVPLKIRYEVSAETCEHLQLVDVEKLQSRALGLNPNGCTTFKAVYEASKQEQRSRALGAHMMTDRTSQLDFVKMNRQSGGDSLHSRTKSAVTTRLQQQGQRRDAMQAQARQRRHRFLER